VEISNLTYFYFFLITTKIKGNRLNTVEKFFDQYAHDFDAIYGTKQNLLNKIINPLFRKSMWIRYEKSISYSDPIENKSVLDIGCGPGHYSIALAKKGAKKVLGVDFADGMIEIAKNRAKNEGVEDKCEFINKDIFEFKDEKVFDYSIIMGVMDYIEHPEEMIEKVISLTSGKAYFSFPIVGGILAMQRQLRYKKRCPLYLYSEKSIKTLFDKFAPHTYKIEKISRDYFVTLTINK